MGYRIIGAFDTETTNIGDALSGYHAFPILYQLGTISAHIKDIKPDNAKHLIDVRMFRHAQDLYSALDDLISAASVDVRVILVHNLGFDMYALAPWLIKHDVRVLAKTAKKPISFQVLDAEGKPALIFLDTLGMFMKSLATMGDECGMPKASGYWDYDLIRTPETPLSDDEIYYAKQDIVTLLCYMGYFLRQNPDINPDDIGLKVQTKTGIVRAKRMKHIGGLKSTKLRYYVRQYWHVLNKSQVPKTDNELFTMHAATRGGFTFVSKNNASKVYMADDEHRIMSFDSTSQHPAQMASHLYPQDFKECDSERLEIAFRMCQKTNLEYLLKYWFKPFSYAFYAAFEFTNLRPKEGSIFEREGIYPLASARISDKAPIYDNQAQSEFKDAIGALGYKDSAVNPVFNFGKMESCSSCILFLTELDAWIVSQCYEFDSVRAISGYLSSTFRKPSDMSILSVMRFYNAKDTLKAFRGIYQQGKLNDARPLKGLFPDSFVDRCSNGEAEPAELREYYMLSKADLNSLFGIEATNECRRDFELDENGLMLVGADGLENMPKTPKCFYQYGQRIVGWSRVAQVVVMQLIAPYVEDIICGDTDSLKIYFRIENLPRIEKALSKHAKALDKAKKIVCKRVRLSYPKEFDVLDGIGHYVYDGEYQGFSASWNKSYIGLVDGKCKLTIAGVPTSRANSDYDSYNSLCDDLISGGMSFEDVASLAIGYNVTLHHNITKLNARIHPARFGDYFTSNVTDYLGNTCKVNEPEALALFPAVKTIGDTDTMDNEINSVIARENNPRVNIKPVLIKWAEGKPRIERG